MEIEAKLAIPNRQIYRALLHTREVAHYHLAPTSAAQVEDRYFDTVDRRLLGAGYTCRLRTVGGLVVATVKGAPQVNAAVHTRLEHEVSLPTWSAEVDAWPASEARELALALCAGAPLTPLFDLTQHRWRADVLAGERLVAEWSLDAVRAIVGRRPALYYELEIECKGAGTESDLLRMVEALRESHGLAPEPRSKFARAVETLQARGTAVAAALTPEEGAALEAFRTGANNDLARRAAVILAWAAGSPTREIVAQSGMSDGRVRFWLRTFRAERMGVFAQTEREQARRSGGAEEQRGGGAEGRGRGGAEERRRGGAEGRRDGGAEEQPGGGAEVRRGVMTVGEFCRSQNADVNHARFVAEQAETLFEQLRPAHRLPEKRGKLLRQAAWFLAAGSVVNPQKPYRGGRDLILAQPFKAVKEGERALLACIVAGQRRNPKLAAEPACAALTPKQREQASLLAALLRLAEALDFSGQASRIKSVTGSASAHSIVALAGAGAELDARQANDQAARWSQLTGQTLAFTALPAAPAPHDATVQTPRLPPDLVIPPVAPNDPMSEAGRKIMLLHFGRMLTNEAGTREGQDIEALHDMRVATRRLRAAYALFADHFEPAALAAFNKGLQRTGRALGAVRDLDVLLDKARAFQAEPAEGEPVSLAPLLADWQARRSTARRAALAHLDSPAYRDFVNAFHRFLTTPGAGARAIPLNEPVAYQVQHVAPRFVISRYEAVRAYEPILAAAPLTTYHALRIDCKRLRYALEFFRDVLGPQGAEVIRQVTALQDLLGALQDAYVAETLIQTFLSEQQGKRKKDARGAALDGVRAYLAAQQAAQQTLLAEFPASWAVITGPAFREALALSALAI